ncbi:MAG: hypothetical protein LQ351_006098 [Letrouitia transgressa]|nr:MAG: hypothetical protein LQ351_006098 [Letrouitia transgressa]
MTKESRQGSPGSSKASSSTSPDQIIYTPLSEDAKQGDNLSAKPPSRRPSPLRSVLSDKSLPPSPSSPSSSESNSLHEDLGTSDFALENLEGAEEDMETRPPFHRPTDGRSQIPLLKEERGRPSYDTPNGSARPPFVARRSTFRSRSPDLEGAAATKKKYIYAGFFLVLSLVAFVVQSETAVYISKKLGWKKPYAMMYATHGSWFLLWPIQLLILRIRSWKTSWRAFWRRHLYILRTTAQMVESQDLHLTTKEAHKSPVGFILRKTAIVTTSLTIAGGSWYVAVGLTSVSDLTAIYNCSAFFAYAFSIPLLNDKLRFDKVFAVIVAIAGVMTIAYGDSRPASIGGDDSPDYNEANNRVLGNIIIGVGSILYGLYEVLYKKLACPPEGVSPSRGAIFANTFGSLIGLFTLLVLWIPLPILHFTGLEPFMWPPGEARWLLFVSTVANAVFSGSFLVLISLTSPVLSSVAALLTIFLVCITDWVRTGEALSTAAIVGGLLIIGAFLLLSWSTYREMEEDRRKALESDPVFSDEDD